MRIAKTCLGFIASHSPDADPTSVLFNGLLEFALILNKCSAPWSWALAQMRSSELCCADRSECLSPSKGKDLIRLDDVEVGPGFTGACDSCISGRVADSEEAGIEWSMMLGTPVGRMFYVVRFWDKSRGTTKTIVCIWEDSTCPHRCTGPLSDEATYIIWVLLAGFGASARGEENECSLGPLTVICSRHLYYLLLTTYSGHTRGHAERSFSERWMKRMGVKSCFPGSAHVKNACSVLF